LENVDKKAIGNYAVMPPVTDLSKPAEPLK
jgi:hypothetical protein